MGGHGDLRGGVNLVEVGHRLVAKVEYGSVEYGTVERQTTASPITIDNVDIQRLSRLSDSSG